MNSKLFLSSNVYFLYSSSESRNKYTITACNIHKNTIQVRRMHASSLPFYHLQPSVIYRTALDQNNCRSDGQGTPAISGTGWPM